MRELGFFKWAIAATVVAVATAGLYGGLGAAAIVLVLIALEASISFDNAIVNATVLRHLSRGWQRAFLTIGIVIAVFGMRVVFPVVIVALATRLGVIEVADLALNREEAYARSVEAAVPFIGSFGGTFLLMVGLSFFFDRERELHWIGPVERPLARAGRIHGLATGIAAVAFLVVSQLLVARPGAERDVLFAGVAALATFLILRSASHAIDRRQGGPTVSGGAGIAAFLYLELLDASFSLDGVLGAFAITRDVVLIALGLGIGAVYVRSLTVYLVRRRALSELPYLTHGAHWAILFLAIVLYASIGVHVPKWLTAAIGLSAIIAALISSIRYRRGRGEGAGVRGEPADPR